MKTPRPPYGFKLVPDPVEQGRIELIRHLHSTGRTPEQIIAFLTGAGQNYRPYQWQWKIKNIKWLLRRYPTRVDPAHGEQMHNDQTEIFEKFKLSKNLAVSQRDADEEYRKHYTSRKQGEI